MENRFLCRGKMSDTGEWVEGYLVQTVESSYIVVPYKHSTIFGEGIVIEIAPSTICQCTGLKDKNGKLIFENDILSGHIDDEFPEDETRKRVVWHENGWCTKEPGCDDYNELDDFDSENFEVIGNIFEGEFNGKNPKKD